MNSDALILFAQIVNAQNINIVLIDDDFSNLCKSDLELRSRLYTNYDYGDFKDFILNYCTEGTIIKIKDHFQLTAYVIQLPENASLSGSHGHYLLIGPVLETQLPQTEITKMIERRGLPAPLYKELLAYYSHIPVPTDLKALESTLLVTARHLLARPYTLSPMNQNEELFIETAPELLKLNPDPNISISTIEERYALEAKMLEAVTAGDQEHAYHYYSRFKTYKIIPRSDNALLNQKNLLIILNTLCRKAVQSGYVHPVYIDDLSTRLAIMINNARSSGELDAIDDDILRKYCLLVRNHSMKNYSQIVQQCITYTDFHYAEPLSLNFFSDMCHVTKSYLSGLFKKETGGNLTDYIHSVRIRHSLILLNSTTLPIHAVAASCGYNDVNYFIKIFKRMNGISPKQYKTQMGQGS